MVREARRYSGPAVAVERIYTTLQIHSLYVLQEEVEEGARVEALVQSVGVRVQQRLQVRAVEATLAAAVAAVAV